jgi:hypothetical protein
MPNALVDKVIKETGMPRDKVEHLWDKAKTVALDAGIEKSDDSDNSDYYAYVVGVFKHMITKKTTKKLNWTYPERWTGSEEHNKKVLSETTYLGTASTVIDGGSIEVTKYNQLQAPEISSEPVPIDANFWLPLAAKQYNISPKLSDYILMPVPTMISSIPNTNGDSVSKEELLSFSTSLGMPAFKTYKGKGVYLEHNHNNPLQSKGIILDVYLRPLKNFAGGSHAKVIELLALDKTKDPILCSKVEDGGLNTVSIGMFYTSYSCSVCGHLVSKSNSKRPCSHTRLGQKTYMNPNTGQLVYRHCHDITGFETSIVEDPAYVCAIGEILR